jgi:mRNA-degrading endonuclease toxin of MazEF toxin-antitoxin module
VIYKRWDIVAIDFPFIEGTGSKRRPGLIVSSERLRSEYGVYWIAMITTAASGPLSNDIPVTNPERAGLPHACYIRIGRIATINDALISRKIGELTAKDRTAATALLRRYVP